jgi:hypothetical protein
MYEELKKPGILKYIPMPLIRSLPCLYYYNKYHKSHENEKAIKFLESNINFLDEALVFISNRLDIHQFKDISRTIYRLKKENPEQYTLHLMIAVEKLACICECNIDKLKKFLKAEKNKLNDIYKKNVLKLLITITNIHGNEAVDKKVYSILSNNCNYDVKTQTADNSEYSSEIINSDLIVFNSTFNPETHRLMDNLKSFKKPGIALVPLTGNIEDDRVSLRHGNQLKKKGFHVIIKSFTPIRMFTSIDREYLKYNLSAN